MCDHCGCRRSALGAAPVAAVTAIAVVAGLNVVAIRLAPPPPKILCLQQLLFGVTVIAVTATALLTA